MSDTMRSLLFAVVLCLICGTLLTAASSGLKVIQQKNITIDRHKNILKSVGLVKPDQAYTADRIDRLYRKNIRHLLVDESGQVVTDRGAGLKSGGLWLPIYLYVNAADVVQAYILPIDTRGLWGKIHGYLALENDGATIAGFTIYQHSETPGLGGEIEQNWFQKNFVGKKVVSPEGDFVSVSIAKGKAADSVPKSRLANTVDGISGATLTGKFLSKGLRDVLTEYESVSIRFRNTDEYRKNISDTPWFQK